VTYNECSIRDVFPTKGDSFPLTVGKQGELGSRGAPMKNGGMVKRGHLDQKKEKIPVHLKKGRGPFAWGKRITRSKGDRL